MTNTFMNDLDNLVFDEAEIEMLDNDYHPFDTEYDMYGDNAMDFDFD